MGNGYITDYRPTTFEGVIGQESVVKNLKSLIDTKSLRHCYLFAGGSGCGKTTLARIFANELRGIVNGKVSIVEMNGSDKNKVDDARELVEAYARSPLIGFNATVIIIDECHRLTDEAQNMLLKTMEDCPRWLYFIFCTTEPKSLLDTFISRCLTINFNKVSEKDILDRVLMPVVEKAKWRLDIKGVSDEEALAKEDEVLEHIAKSCNGSPRFALSWLERCYNLDYDQAIETLNNLTRSGGGKNENEFVMKLYGTILDGNWLDKKVDNKVQKGAASFLVENLKKGLEQSMDFTYVAHQLSYRFSQDILYPNPEQKVELFKDLRIKNGLADCIFLLNDGRFDKHAKFAAGILKCCEIMRKANND